MGRASIATIIFCAQYARQHAHPALETGHGRESPHAASGVRFAYIKPLPLQTQRAEIHPSLNSTKAEKPVQSGYAKLLSRVHRRFVDQWNHISCT
jgi:hypothetical protein